MKTQVAGLALSFAAALAASSTAAAQSVVWQTCGGAGCVVACVQGPAAGDAGTDCIVKRFPMSLPSNGVYQASVTPLNPGDNVMMTACRSNTYPALDGNCDAMLTTVSPSVGTGVFTLLNAPANGFVQYQANPLPNFNGKIVTSDYYAGTLTLTADFLCFGFFVANSDVTGTGAVIHQSGTNTVEERLSVGFHAGDVGTYTMSGGKILAGYETIGRKGSGTFNQSGGINASRGPITIAEYPSFPSTSGIYNLSGGMVDAPSVVNNGTFNISGGTVNAPLTNTGALYLSGAPIINGAVTNSGTIKATGASTRFNGAYVENGTFVSDPSTQQVGDLTVNPSGALVGGAGDRWVVTGNLSLQSTQASRWNTRAAALVLAAGTTTQHTLQLGNSDRAYRWGTLDITGNVLHLDGNANARLYTGKLLGVTAAGGALTNLTSANGVSIAYDSTDPDNAYLASLPADIPTGGQLIPTVPPSAGPTANAGPNQLVDTGVVVTLDGSHSTATGGATIASYLWTQLAGPTAALSDPAAASPTFTAGPEGASYAFELTVTDSNGQSDLAAVSVQVRGPVVDASVPPDDASAAPSDASGAADAAPSADASGAGTDAATPPADASVGETDAAEPVPPTKGCGCASAGGTPGILAFAATAFLRLALRRRERSGS